MGYTATGMDERYNDNEIHTKVLVCCRSRECPRTGHLRYAGGGSYRQEMQMIEYGNVLPESGKEKEWFKHLSNKLKKKLSKMETRN